MFIALVIVAIMAVIYVAIVAIGFVLSLILSVFNLLTERPFVWLFTIGLTILLTCVVAHFIIG